MHSKRKLEYPLTHGKMKLLREHLGYNHHEMAGRIGVSIGGYRKYESGFRSPSFTTIARMVKEFNISMDWFYFDKGPMFYQGESEKAALQQENTLLKNQLQQSQEDLEESRRKMEQVTQQLADKELLLKNKQQQLDALPTMSPDVKELAEEMSQDRLLNHEILAHFLRFKSGAKE